MKISIYRVLAVITFMGICLYYPVVTFAQGTRNSLQVPQQYSTIQSAVNAAGIGDTILVSPGFYYENINFIGKPVTVASQYLLTGDSSKIIQTVIDGNHAGPVVTFNSLEKETSVLVGFTLRNGQSEFGGGISCLNADPVLSNLIIKNCSADNGGGIYLYESNAYIWRVALTGNSATGYGGGISCDYYAYPAVYNTRIFNNSASLGGGIHCYLSSPYIAAFDIYGNVADYGSGIYLYWSAPFIWSGMVHDNTALYYGGGIECDYYSEPILSYLQIDNNNASYGGGIHFYYSNALVDNSTIVSNQSQYGGGIYCYYAYPEIHNTIVAFNSGEYGLYAYESSPIVKYSNFWENEEGDFLNVDDQIGELSQININHDSCDMYFNIFKDPLFVDQSLGDYHLTSGSRCIDAGDPGSPSDADSSTRDIGKYYYHQSFVANFKADIVYGLPPLTVHFTDISSGQPMTWAWDFDNDGVIDTYEPNPVWVYDEMADYSVSLRITRGFLNDKRVKPDFIKVFFTPKPGLSQISDVPGDQGGWVAVDFLRSVHDTDTLLDRSTESYTVQYNDGDGWVSANSTAAYGADEYTILCHTPYDSTNQGNGLLDFRIIASMDEGNFVSNMMQGYSVDNLQPQVPDHLAIEVQENTFGLSWDAVPDPDLAYYAVYQSTMSGNFVENPVYTTEPYCPDIYIGTYPCMYAVRAIDHSGNFSDFSDPVEAPLMMMVELEPGWNSISGFVEPVDPQFEDVFSGLENQVEFLCDLYGYWYPGGSQTTLTEWNSSTGYHLKMNEPAVLALTGFFISDSTLRLLPGWNLVPVLSPCPVYVDDIFDGCGSDLLLIRDAVGRDVAWPEKQINTLEILTPGKAYLFYMKEISSVSFPGCD